MSSSRLCLALDVSTAAEAERWVERTRGAFGIYKIGLQLFCAEGRRVVERVRAAGAPRIFLDLKLHDIPNTVASAVRALGDLGVDWLTVHTGGGAEMMRAAADAADEAGVELLGVTVLTSLDERAAAAGGLSGPLPELVDRRAKLAVEQGLPGLVCSPHEAARLRALLGDEVRLVTPGIRLVGADHGDQKRVATPRMALAAGASCLVIGRAVTRATDLDAALGALREAAR